MSCRLCSHTTTVFTELRGRVYEKCTHCHLVQVSEAHLPSAQVELEETSLHQNDSSDPGYRRFLQPALLAGLDWLKGSASATTIVDFGSGPGPALPAIFAEHGWTVQCTDPLFGPVECPDECDLVLCTEVVEHFHRPAVTWAQLAWMLRAGGAIVVMTALADHFADPVAFRG